MAGENGLETSIDYGHAPRCLWGSCVCEYARKGVVEVACFNGAQAGARGIFVSLLNNLVL